MGAEFAGVNWAAVIAGTVAAFIFGWILYSPAVAGRAWAKGSGVDLEAGGAPPVGAMIVQIIALFCLAVVIGVTETSNALMAAIVAILAVVAFVVSGGAFQRKSGAALAVDGGYALGAGVLMILAQGLL